MGRGIMLILNSKARQRLWRIVRRLSGDIAAHEDLMQEALVHLWQQEIERPAQTESWYLQSCRFHLLNYLNRGRSVDSFKHRREESPVGKELESSESRFGNGAEGESPLDSVCALDIVELLSKRLDDREQEILAHLAQGSGPREIAKKLRISHQSVSKHRQKLAALAIRMGIAPLSASRDRSEPTRKHPER
jgi:RNA polymerase sigma factor (sigma-70 family)